MDLEGFTRRRILKGRSEKEIVRELDEVIKEFKEWDRKKRKVFSKAVYDEVKTTLTYKGIKDAFLKEIIGYPKSGVTMGGFGVGSRGRGDFFVHRRLSEVIGKSSAIIDTRHLDDAGVVKGEGGYITIAVDGVHSRLSEFPFLAGFHVARAALRDIYAMGSKPIAIVSDFHLADDGDIGKLFDFTAGIATVSELTNTPLIAGSTLRVGGDMVFGDRLVSAAATIGSSHMKPKARRDAQKGDIILLTEGKGGGTVTTIALYHGKFDIIKETLNVDFMDACEALMKNGLLNRIHTMTDVTNGGLRGDAWEISQSSGKRLVFYENAVRNSVNKKVLKTLEELEIDYLGISTDSLMLILPEEYADEVKESLDKVTKVYEVGRVEVGKGVGILADGREEELRPLFRESAYTKIKKVVEEGEERDMDRASLLIENAKESSIKKKDRVIKYIRGQNC